MDHASHSPVQPSFRISNPRTKDIKRSRRFQMREESLDRRLVEKYAEDMQNGEEFPPIDVARIKGKLYVIDGFHRLAAALSLGRSTIPATVRTMTYGEALDYAMLQANTRHGSSLNRRDKLRILERYVEEGMHIDPVTGLQKPYRTIEGDLGRIVSSTTIWRYLSKRGIQKLDEYGEEPSPFAYWESNPSEDEIMDEALSLIKSLYQLCLKIDRADQMSRIIELIDHLKAGISSKEIEMIELTDTSYLDI